MVLTGVKENGTAVSFDKVSVSGTENKDAAKLTNGEYNKTSEKLTWKTGDSLVTLKNLENGTYTLEETAAPNGFVTVSTFKFVVKEIYINGN